MGDPAASFRERRSPAEGVGPYRSGEELPQVPALGVGDDYRVDLRRYDNGRYVALSPQGYDSVTVVNSSERRLVLSLNDGASSITVPPTSTNTLTHAGTYVVRVENVGSTAVSNAGDVVVEVQKEAFGADERARRQTQKGALASVVEKFTGLPVGGR